jgi:hypothetical protein
MNCLKATWLVAWKRFTIITRIVGDVQGNVLASLLYFTVIAPFGLLLRLTGDPLRLRHPDQTWLAKDPVDHTLEGAKRQG